MPTLLLFAPNASRRSALEEQLSRWPELELRLAKTLPELKNALTEKPDALLLETDEMPEPELLGTIPRLSLGPGGDMPRPLRWTHLAARLSLLLGRSQAEEGFTVGPYSCLPLERILIDADGAECARLTDKEVQLLRMLSETGIKGMTRDDLLEKVWGYREGLDTHTLETHIYRLRQKIEADPAQPQLLVTMEGGYALTPPPEE